MNNNSTFQTITDEVLIELINEAQDRLVFIAPGVRVAVADALINAANRLRDRGGANFILDVDAEVCRLGYGDLEGLKKLQEMPGMNGDILHAQPGLRIGVVIADDNTLFYSPTPLLIEAEPSRAEVKPARAEAESSMAELELFETEKKDDSISAAVVSVPQKPNGVLIRKSVPAELANACSANGNYSKREIGLDPVRPQDVKKVDESLQRIPPKKFDLARQERVFSSKLCFMEFEIRDYHITSKTVPLGSELFVKDNDTKKRLTNRFKVFDKDRLPKDVKYSDGKEEITLSMQSIEQRISDLRKQYLINVGKWGTVILRCQLNEFKEKSREIVNMLKTYNDFVLGNVEKLTMDSCRKLVDEISPKLIETPPVTLGKRLAIEKTGEEKKETIIEYITERFKKDVNDALKDFNPKITMVEKDVTYNTFSDPDFIKMLERPAPAGLGPDCMKKIFEEHDSARESK